MLTKYKIILFLLTSVFLLVASVQAQQPNTDAMRWRYIGPVGNRTTSVVGVPGQPYIYYAGSASGGIFKTTDGGIHWEPIFDSQPVSSIGSLAVAPSDPNIVWAGTGEAWIRSHISVGQGIYKSTDAGKTWTLMGLEKTGRIGHLVIDPKNPDIVMACAGGHVAARDSHLGTGKRRAGQRSLCVARRRRHVDKDNGARFADAHDWQVGTRNRALESKTHLCPDRNRRRCSLQRTGN